MKRKTLQWLSSFALLLSLGAISSGCENEDDDDGMRTVSGTLNSTVEIPAPTVPSTGSGTLTGTYNVNTNLLTYNVTWTGLTATASAAHFHGPALPGFTAPPVVTFTLNNSGTAGNASGTFTLSDAQEQELLDGKWYVNVHTPNNTPGEIRSQVAVTD